MPLPKLHAIRALRHRDFAKLWVGYGFSEAGSQITQVAIAWQLWLLTHSALSLGLVGLFRFLPILIMALFGGAVADAVDRRRLMIAAQLALAVNSAALAVLTFEGRATPAALYAFAFLAGLAKSFDNPARQALLPNLVPADELPNALSLNATVWQIATVLGPSMGGAIVAFRGPGLAYAIDAASFLALAFAAYAIRHRATQPPPKGALSFRAIGDGLRFVARTPVISWLMALDFVACLFAGSMMLMPIYADKLLNVGATGLGLLYSAPAVGALAAALIMAGRRPVRRQGPVVLVSVAAYGLAIALFGLSREFPLSLFCLAASGAADTVSMIQRQTIRQLLTPDAMRGRMTSINMVFYMGGPQLGEFEAGVVAKALGPTFSVVSGGLACVVAALGFAVWAPSLRRIRDTTQAAPEPQPEG